MRSAADQLLARQRATEKLTALYGLAAEVAIAHEQAGMRLPEAVAGLLGPPKNTPNTNGSQEKATWRYSVVCPFARPHTAKPNWISVAVNDAGLFTLLRYVLGGSKFPVMSREFVSAVLDLRPGSTNVAVYNALARLQALKVVEQVDDSGWRLRSGVGVPTLLQDRLWGPVEVFQNTEIAGFRREAILEFIRVAAPVSRAELLQAFRKTDWTPLTPSDHNVKADLEALEIDGQVVQDPSTWRWSFPKKGQLKLA